MIQTSNEMKEIMSQYRDAFISDDINKHLMFLREIGVYWSLSITETYTTAYSTLTPEVVYELRFIIGSKTSKKERSHTIYEFNVLDNSTNIYDELRSNVFNWDYNKLNEFFNDKSN